MSNASKLVYVPTWSNEDIAQYEDYMAEAMQAEEELEVLRSIAEETHTAWVEFEGPEFNCSSSLDEGLSEDEIDAMNASFLSTYERELPRHMRSPEDI
jgi:hypothetical protein